MILCLEKYLKLSWGSGHWKGCSLWVTVKWWRRVTWNLMDLVMEVAHNTYGIEVTGRYLFCACRHCAYSCIPTCRCVRLCEVFCIHPLFLEDDTVCKQMWTLGYAQLFLNTLISLKLVHIFRTSIITELTLHSSWHAASGFGELEEWEYRKVILYIIFLYSSNSSMLTRNFRVIPFY